MKIGFVEPDRLYWFLKVNHLKHDSGDTPSTSWLRHRRYCHRSGDAHTSTFCVQLADHMCILRLHIHVAKHDMRTDVVTRVMAVWACALEVSLAVHVEQPYTGLNYYGIIIIAEFEHKHIVGPAVARVTFCPCRLECYRFLVLGQARLRLIRGLEAFLQGLHLRNTDGFRTFVGHSHNVVLLTIFSRRFLKRTQRRLSVPGMSTIPREANLTTRSTGTIVASPNAYSGSYGGGMFPQ